MKLGEVFCDKTSGPENWEESEDWAPVVSSLNIIQLPETNSSHLRAMLKIHLPTIDFQGRFVSLSPGGGGVRVDTP